LHDRRHDARALSFEPKERTMTELYDTIQELRLELKGCLMTQAERKTAEAELARAIAEHAEIDWELDCALAAWLAEQR
jgi:hypothetical protein